MWVTSKGNPAVEVTHFASSSFDNFELIEMGLDFCRFVPESTSSNFSSAGTYVSFFAVTSFSLSMSLLSSKFSWATHHTKLLCCDLCLGPPCVLQVGPVHLYNL